MEMTSAKWVSELEMEDAAAFNYQYPLDYSIDELEFQFFSYKKNFNHQTVQNFSYATDSWNSCTSPSSSSHMISFGNSNPPPSASYGVRSIPLKPNIEMGSDENSKPSLFHPGSLENQYGSNYNNNFKQGTHKKGAAVTIRDAQDHVMAERKRREKLSQRFIALSAVIPGLKKMDKASVLEDAVKYMKNLQQRVKTLEDQSTMKSMESVVFVKKSKVYVDDDQSSSSTVHDDINSDEKRDQLQLPDIEARVSDRNVLIKIHCEKRKGCIVKILYVMEKFHLNVINSSVIPFGNSTLDVTIVAQMDGEFSTTIKDLLRNLRQALLN
ncbi:transcription factor bHLH19 [Mercurialis annua]|uniref:transcription factor bHLH19 n=1 Tax=Mercurialis annua TaxID=3986 RepID=UPI0021604594|nr:transcription factor bHLH19 [Mercurialis annua]